MAFPSTPSDSDQRLESFRSGLQQEIKVLRTRLNGQNPADTLARDGQPADDSIDSVERETSLRHREALLRRSHQVMRALERLEHGTFGVCQGCGEAIEPRRLDHDPSTELCLQCQIEDDRRARTPSL